jgi:biotin---protein ligase
LKWPNDIYAYDRQHDRFQKVGGVLVSSEYRNGCYELVIGCGLNVGNPEPTISLQQVLHSTELTVENVLAAVLVQFERMHRHLLESAQNRENEYFAPFTESYHKRWLHSGHSVDIHTSTAPGGQARILGIDPTTGLLRAQLADSKEIIQLQPDGNSFDMMRGLIFAKEA